MKAISVSRSLWAKVLCVPLIFLLSGCVWLAVGAVGAVGGYAASPDTFEGILENEQSAVWDASVEVISIMGVIQEEDHAQGTIQATVSGAKITATVTQSGKNAVKLSIKARKLGLPKVSLAQDIYVKISNHLNK
ncbi:MAG: DUF3568 family protein [Candidatus Omnitrophica bacterium]|nr:DUF3568 family protein [Candidatus Omnitrophota bacterium]